MNNMSKMVYFIYEDFIQIYNKPSRQIEATEPGIALIFHQFQDDSFLRDLMLLFYLMPIQLTESEIYVQNEYKT